MRGAVPLPSTIPSLNKLESSELQRVFGRPSNLRESMDAYNPHSSGMVLFKVFSYCKKAFVRPSSFERVGGFLFEFTITSKTLKAYGKNIKVFRSCLR
jgi:hypothetical protein